MLHNGTPDETTWTTRCATRQTLYYNDIGWTWLTSRLIWFSASFGSRNSYDNALTETINGLYKAEVVHKNRPWRGWNGLAIADCGDGRLLSMKYYTINRPSQAMPHDSNKNASDKFEAIYHHSSCLYWLIKMWEFLSVITAEVTSHQACFVLYGRVKAKRRVFKHHSKRWKYGIKAKKPDQLIQIDPWVSGLTTASLSRCSKPRALLPAWPLSVSIREPPAVMPVIFWDIS